MANAKEFMIECTKELKKVHWPEKPTVMQTSLIVAVCTGIFAAYLYLVDLGLAQVFKALIY
ncbi:MAG: preprotein translocase subunit SecE [Acidobacteria bacterium]|nr:preprotein translocase subunit SecE [Acidobacteriota bacterium]